MTNKADSFPADNPVELVPYGEMFPPTAVPPAGAAHTQIAIVQSGGRHELWVFPTADTRHAGTFKEILYLIREVIRDYAPEGLQPKADQLFPLVGRLAFLRAAPPSTDRTKAIVIQGSSITQRRPHRCNGGHTTEWHVAAAVIAWHLRAFWKRHDQRIELSDKGPLIDVVHQLLERLGYRDAKQKLISKSAIGKHLRRQGWKSDPAN